MQQVFRIDFHEGMYYNRGDETGPYACDRAAGCTDQE